MLVVVVRVVVLGLLFFVLLRSGFVVRQTNIFEVMLSGSTIPSSFRDEPYLSCRGVTMSMAFSGG